MKLIRPCLLLLLLSVSMSLHPDDFGFIPGVSEQRRSKKIYHTSLVDIFTHKTSTWVDGSKISIIEFPKYSVESKSFVILVLNMTPNQYRIKSEINFLKETKVPHYIVKNRIEMIRKLAETQYSVGYLDDIVYYKDNEKIWKVYVIY